MQFGQLALGLASLVLGVHHLSNGQKRLRQSRDAGLSRIDPRQPLRRTTAMTPSGPMTLTTYEVRTLEDRIARIRDLTEKGKRDPQIYAFARRAVNQRCGDRWCTPEKNNLAEVKAMFGAIRNNVRYTSDIRGIDSYQKPKHTLGLRGGDCDDFTSISCASLESIGIPCAFKAIRLKGSPEFNHIYALAGLPRARPTRWIPFDASVNMPVGWEAPKHMVAEARVFPLSKRGGF